ncbi:hypothetical protein M1349_01155 [Patescibacteria group bacterium]|nr:hypothetical protein [Patescibacteria group bacterium]
MKKTHIDKSDIEAFLQQADLIFNSEYLQKPVKQSVNLCWKKGEPLLVTSIMPTREVIESFILRMRPVIVRNERLYVGKIVHGLIGETKDESEKNKLIKIQSLIEKHRERRLFTISVNNKEYGMPDFVWLYLYGKYFHLDKEKQEIIKQFESTLGSFSELSALSQLEGYAGLILFVAGYIKRKRKLI